MDTNEKNKKPSVTKLLVYFFIDAFLLIAFILLNNMHSTGKNLHETLGAVLGAIILVHFFVHWKRIVGYFKRIFKKHEFLLIGRLIINIALFACLSAIIITGLMMSRSLLPSLGIQLGRAGREIEMYHKMITHYTIYILALHLVFQWKWYFLLIKHTIIDPIANLFQKKRSNEIA